MPRFRRSISLRAFVLLAPPTLVAFAVSLAASSGVSSPSATDAGADGEVSNARGSDAAKKVDAAPGPQDGKPGAFDAKLPWGDARNDVRFEVFSPVTSDAIPLAKEIVAG